MDTNTFHVLAVPGTESILAMSLIEVFPQLPNLPSAQSVLYIYLLIATAVLLVAICVIVAFVRRRRRKQIRYIDLKQVTEYETATITTCVSCTIDPLFSWCCSAGK